MRKSASTKTKLEEGWEWEKWIENGELYADFCMNHDLVIGGALQDRTMYQVTWISPGSETKIQPVSTTSIIFLFEEIRFKLPTVKQNKTPIWEEV